MSWIQINVADAFFQLLFIRENYYIQMYFGEFIFLSIKKKKSFMEWRTPLSKPDMPIF